MPTKSDTKSQPENTLSDTLAADLQKIAQLVREGLNTAPGCPEALALACVINGVRVEDWGKFASLHGLENWLGIPLHGELGESVTQLLSVQEKLLLQRDHDVLTGINNHGYFNRQLESEVERALRSRTELCIIYIDLDNFKNINDTYGHNCGDIVLQRLAKVLQASVRPYDVVARIGGEEFALILPTTSCWSGMMSANRILDAFSKEVFSYGDASFFMTFSGGVSSLSLLDEDNRTNVELLQSVDTALYEAKRKGKNNVTMAESNRLVKDRESLVQAQEKQFLFSYMDSE
jgi:diguanylate cyclase (GGDEF)-like protein